MTNLIKLFSVIFVRLQFVEMVLDWLQCLCFYISRVYYDIFLKIYVNFKLLSLTNWILKFLSLSTFFTFFYFDVFFFNQETTGVLLDGIDLSKFEFKWDELFLLSPVYETPQCFYVSIHWDSLVLIDSIGDSTNSLEVIKQRVLNPSWFDYFKKPFRLITSFVSEGFYFIMYIEWTVLEHMLELLFQESNDIEMGNKVEKFLELCKTEKGNLACVTEAKFNEAFKPKDSNDWKKLKNVLEIAKKGQFLGHQSHSLTPEKGKLVKEVTLHLKKVHDNSWYKVFNDIGFHVNQNWPVYVGGIFVLGAVSWYHYEECLGWYKYTYSSIWNTIELSRDQLSSRSQQEYINYHFNKYKGNFSVESHFWKEFTEVQLTNFKNTFFSQGNFTSTNYYKLLPKIFDNGVDSNLWVSILRENPSFFMKFNQSKIIYISDVEDIFNQLEKLFVDNYLFYSVGFTIGGVAFINWVLSHLELIDIFIKDKLFFLWTIENFYNLKLRSLSLEDIFIKYEEQKSNLDIKTFKIKEKLFSEWVMYYKTQNN